MKEMAKSLERLSDEGKKRILKMLDDLQEEICGSPKKKRFPEHFIKKQKENNEKEPLLFRGILISELDEDSLFAAVRYLGQIRMKEMEIHVLELPLTKGKESRTI